MNPEAMYQGGKDVFLTKVRADFDAIEDLSLIHISEPTRPY